MHLQIKEEASESLKRIIITINIFISYIKYMYKNSTYIQYT